MTRNITLTMALTIVVLGYAGGVVPTQAANRLMSSSLEGFQYRCENHGGAFTQDGPLVSCQTPSVMVSCEYFTGRQADCNWQGTERQIDVLRVIGSLPADAQVVASSGNGGGPGAPGGGGNGGGGGGFQGPKDIKAAPDNTPNPGFDGPKTLGIAP